MSEHKPEYLNAPEADGAIVVGKFAPYAAEAIADALERDHMPVEAQEWRDAATQAARHAAGLR